MSTPPTHLLSACVITALVMPGCALLSKGDQGAARFFSLERAHDRVGAVAAQATRARAAAPQLRLGRITGAPHLGERLVVRDSAYEISYHRDLRWTEPPQQYLKRMLTRVFFEQRRLRHVVAGRGSS